MQMFHVRYRNSQGALMRILNAVSRRGLELTSVHAEYAGIDHGVTLLLNVTQKQSGQLYREWNSVVDVLEVRSTAALRDPDTMWAAHPPASQPIVRQAARAGLA